MIIIGGFLLLVAVGVIFAMSAVHNEVIEGGMSDGEGNSLTTTLLMIGFVAAVIAIHIL